MSNVIPFRPRAKAPQNRGPEARSQYIRDEDGELFSVLTENGAATLLGISVDEFRAQQLLEPFRDADGDFWYLEDAVIALVVARGGIAVFLGNNPKGAA